MPVARHPPHRSQRALLTHWAPTSSGDVEAFRRPGVTDTVWRKPPTNKGPEALPRKPVNLTPAAQGAHPVPGDLFPEEIEGPTVRGHGMIGKVPLHNLTKPPPLHCKRPMTPPPELELDKPEPAAHAHL